MPNLILAAVVTLGALGGGQLSCHERSRLSGPKTTVPANVVLAAFGYDPLGRRISFVDPVAGITTRYYYDGARVIEERNGSDVRQRYHVHGGQYVDEHVATYNDAAGSYKYYLENDLHTVVGVGDSGGMVAETYSYGAYGLSGVSGAGCRRGDLDGDNDVDIGDILQFVAVLLTATGTQQELCAGDVNADGMVDGDDVQPFVSCVIAHNCPPAGGGSGLRSPFTLHGAAVDVLSGGLMLQRNGARYYDIKNGRWLQRDPVGYVDGGNLYEAFGGNALTNVDPMGTDWFARVFMGTAGESVSTFDAIFSRETADIVTFGLFDFAGNSADQARYRAARMQGIVSPTIRAGEFYALGPTAGIRSLVLRNAAGGLIVGVGETIHDCVVDGSPPNVLRFAQTSAVGAAGGMICEGLIVVGGRAFVVVNDGVQRLVVEMRGPAARAFDAVADVGLGLQTRIAQAIDPAARPGSMYLGANMPPLSIPRAGPLRSDTGSRQLLFPFAEAGADEAIGGTTLSIVERTGMNVRSVVDQFGRPVAIYGQAERAASATPGHAETISSLVEQLAQSGQYEYITDQ